VNPWTMPMMRAWMIGGSASIGTTGQAAPLPTRPADVSLG
jgi:hypothetical protein